MKSTPEMRARIRELMTNSQDDYDRAVECVLDDLDELIAGHHSISELSDVAKAYQAQIEAMHGWCADVEKRALSAEARLAEAVKALDPFEDYPDWAERKNNEMTGMRITYRQLRAAHAALRIVVSGSTEGGNG